MNVEAVTSVSKGCFVYTNGGTAAHGNKYTNRKSLNKYERPQPQQSRTFLNDDIMKQPFYQIYQQMWRKVKDDMESIQNENNSRVLENIVDYVTKCTYGEDTDYQLGEYILPTVALLIGINQPDHLKLFHKLSKQLREKLSCSVCILQSKDCPTPKQTLENIVHNLLQTMPSKLTKSDNKGDFNDNIKVEKENFANTPKYTKRFRYTMWHLKQCYSGSKNKSNNSKKMSQHFLIVILSDFECFSRAVLQNLIEILSSYCNELPFILILGVATTISTIHDILPYQVTSKIRLDTFEIPSAATTLYEILDKIILSPKICFHLSGKTLEFLCHVFFYYDYSLTGFIQSFKYCMMEHYNQGNAYSLCSSSYVTALENIQYLNHADLEDIRKQLSFRPFVESLSDNKRIIAILTNDEHLQKELPLLLKQCHKYFTLRHIFLEFLYQLVHDLPKAPLGKTRYELYIRTMSTNIFKQIEYKECWQLLKMLSKEDLLKKFQIAVKRIRLLIRNDIQNNDFHIDKGADIWQECKTVIQEKINRIETFLNSIENDGDTENQLTFTQSNYNQLKNITSRYDLKEKLQQMSKQQKPQFNEYGQACQKLLIYIEDLLRQFIKAECDGPPLHELFVFSNIENVKNNLMSAPRAALHMALSNPQFYLQCECCELKNATQLLATLPDISIVYKLHLECGRMINLYDWLQAFNAIVHCVDKLENEKYKEQNEKHDNEQISAHIQARFARAIAELQFLGYIKMSKRKTDHATRLTW